MGNQLRAFVAQHICIRAAVLTALSQGQGLMEDLGDLGEVIDKDDVTVLRGLACLMDH